MRKKKPKKKRRKNVLRETYLRRALERRRDERGGRELRHLFLGLLRARAHEPGNRRVLRGGRGDRFQSFPARRERGPLQFRLVRARRRRRRARAPPRGGSVLLVRAPGGVRGGVRGGQDGVRGGPENLAILSRDVFFFFFFRRGDVVRDVPLLCVGVGVVLPEQQARRSARRRRERAVSSGGLFFSHPLSLLDAHDGGLRSVVAEPPGVVRVRAETGARGERQDRCLYAPAPLGGQGRAGGDGLGRAGGPRAAALRRMGG